MTGHDTEGMRRLIDAEAHYKNYSLGELLQEVDHVALQNPTQHAHTHASRTRSPAPEAYDPSAPIIPSLLTNKIRAISARRAAREATPLYTHNPHFLTHALAGAPYTTHRCKCCTPRRRCPLHRETLQLQTSISLCAHRRLNLFWHVDDATNAKNSWQLGVKTYGLGADGEREAEHRACEVVRPSERVAELAERVVQDMQDRKMMRGHQLLLRGNVDRVRGEIHALLGAWEYGVAEAQRKAQAKHNADRKAQAQLAETMRMVQRAMAQRDRDAPKKRKIDAVEADAADVVQSVEGVKSVRLDKSTTLTPTSWHGSQEGSSIITPRTPTAEPPLALTKKASKRVHWPAEIVAEPVVPRPRIMSPKYVAAVREVLDDEVDYSDGEEDEEDEEE
ncbi:hypothetical protein BDV95DRAFT_609999 [Massariosphaeria phaeospora]|uniref:Uncharacterized protein n=1 Tax=Massariosphaeria phaeospora TaxID=100035 RepID=A0A7C8MG22_9PLEO|nr:hypothetical protein BDV95DRAFT_609999 [Massariosphaeria phaeospora]